MFDDLPPGAPAGGLPLLTIPVPAAQQNKAQRLFIKLVGQIQQQRDLLAQWQQFDLHHHQRLAAWPVCWPTGQPARRGGGDSCLAAVKPAA